MFPEYQDLIEQLKSTDPHFLELFNRHKALDDKVRAMEAAHVELGTPEEIEKLKKEKLLLKDQMYSQLRKARAATA